MPGTSRSIYVQIDMRASPEEVWQRTQEPALHQQWDLRFSEITYLPRTDPAAPQQFLYLTRLGFGLVIRGRGETVGSSGAPDRCRTSALKFWSDERLSLIRAGSGYWKYEPLDGGHAVRFITGYDYQVRFGVPGRLFDRLVFRPLMGWATAWSFDRLRLWIEQGIAPAAAMRQSMTYAIARVAVALVWLYQGAVPKLLARHADELRMLRAGGLSDAAARVALPVMGWLEIAIGLVLLLAWRARWPLWGTLMAMPLALITVAIRSPQFLVAAFNPVALNLAVFALAVVALLQPAATIPSARRCPRKPPAVKGIE